jgi:hypothetical protein
MNSTLNDLLNARTGVLVSLTSDLPKGSFLPLPVRIAVPENWESAAAVANLQQVLKAFRLRDCHVVVKDGALLLRTFPCCNYESAG